MKVDYQLVPAGHDRINVTWIVSIVFSVRLRVSVAVVKTLVSYWWSSRHSSLKKVDQENCCGAKVQVRGHMSQVIVLPIQKVS